MLIKILGGIADGVGGIADGEASLDDEAYASYFSLFTKWIRAREAKASPSAMPPETQEATASRIADGVIHFHHFACHLRCLQDPKTLVQ